MQGAVHLAHLRTSAHREGGDRGNPDARAPDKGQGIPWKIMGSMEI